MLDCDNYSCSDLPAAEAFAKVKEVVLVPLLAFITAKTGKVVSLDELCVQSACRKQKPVNNVPRTFTPFGVPGCKPEATLVPETGVAAAQHIYSFQAKPIPT